MKVRGTESLLSSPPPCWASAEPPPAHLRKAEGKRTEQTGELCGFTFQELSGDVFGHPFGTQHM